MRKIKMSNENIIVNNDTSWQPEEKDSLISAIERMEFELPGWWWRAGSCHVSSDASIGPDRIGPAAALLHNDKFSTGIHEDLPHPSTCAQALNAVIDRALELIKENED